MIISRERIGEKICQLKMNQEVKTSEWALNIVRQQELEKRKIKWCKRTIDVMLSNEKYMSEVKLLKSSESEVHYLAWEIILR